MIKAFRPLLGSKGCCIYTITCTEYAEFLLKQKPLYVAIPLIIFRILKCNPIAAIIMRIKLK